MRPLLIVMLLVGAARAEDESEENYRAGIQLAANEQFADALVRLEASYAARQRPILLYEMGRVQQKLGRAAEARALYQRYLTADLEVPPTRRAEIEGRMHVLERGLPPAASGVAAAQPERPEAPPGSFYVLAKPEMRPRRELWIAGTTILTIGYVPALITGAVLSAFNSNNRERDAFGTVMIPVFGPIISAALLPEPAWAIPMVVVDGLMQMGGMAMIIAGALTKKKVFVLDPPVKVGALPLPGGGGLVAHGTF